jgi:ferredoxin-NADP reductase
MTLELLVERKEKAADGVVSLTLRAPGGEPLPPWEPGAHIDLRLPGDVVRQYSLCGNPEDASAYRVAVLREPDGRGGSAYVHDELLEGDRLQVDGPRNHFALVDAERYLFLAGGIGIPPILPMPPARNR